MKKYTYEKIDNMIKPLMEMMREEYPNGYRLVIEPEFAQIEHISSELTFMQMKTL